MILVDLVPPVCALGDGKASLWGMCALQETTCTRASHNAQFTRVVIPIVTVAPSRHQRAQLFTVCKAPLPLRSPMSSQQPREIASGISNPLHM